MAASTSNFRIGSRQVTYGGTDLGQTGEDTTITIEKTLVPITGDETGSTPVDRAIEGMAVKATVTFKEFSKGSLQNLLANILAENTTATADRIDVHDETNTMQSVASATLVLRPRNAAADGTTAADEEFIIWKATSTVVGDINFDNQAQVGTTVEFEGLIDATNGLFTYGDSTT